MNISSLVASITPLYNNYKQTGRSISGCEALEIMWDIGDLLRVFIEKNNVAPHALYREIYGKGEGSTNIAKRSWITREFQGRCYRIRKIFITKDKITDELPTLKSFTSFRESMPFFDNEKYKLKGQEKQGLLRLLNSNKSKKSILDEIRKLQKKKIGIKNPRNQRLNDLESEKQIFIDFYNFVYRLQKESRGVIIDKLNQNGVHDNYITAISRNTNAMSQDGLRFFDFEIKIDMHDSLWGSYGKVVKHFSLQKDAKNIRRFRRLIPPERIVKLADMLNSLLSNKNKQ